MFGVWRFALGQVLLCRNGFPTHDGMQDPRETSALRVEESTDRGTFLGETTGCRLSWDFRLVSQIGF